MGEKEILVCAEIPGYPPEVGAALWRLEEARERTLRLLEDVPDDYVDLETRGNSIGTILYHVALIEADWLYVEILEEPFSDELKRLLPAEDRDHEGILTVVQRQSLAEHTARLSAIREIFLTEMRGMTIADFNRARSLPNYEVSPAWVLHHLAQHEAEHRGELASTISQIRNGNQSGTIDAPSGAPD